MKNKKESFPSVLQSLGYRYDLRPVFDDLLTISLCSFSRDISTGIFCDEDLYLETIAGCDGTTSMAEGNSYVCYMAFKLK